MSEIAHASRTSVLTKGVALISLAGAGAVLLWVYKWRISARTQESNNAFITQELSKIYSTIENLRHEIEALKFARLDETTEQIDIRSLSSSSRKGKTVRFRKPSSIISSRSSGDESDYKSAWGDAMESSDEFFDISSDNEADQDIEKQIEEVNRSATLLSTSQGASVLSFDALDLFDQVDSLLQGSNDDIQDASKILLDQENEYGDNVEFLWRLAKAERLTAQVYGAKGDSDKQKEMTFRAFEYAKRALAADDMNAEAHKWYAITLGAKGEYLGVSDKIRDGFTFKEHIDRAVQLNPSDPTLHHLLGRFSWGVSSLSWIERKVATTLFGAPPTSSFQEGLAHFLKAEEMHGRDWKENQLFIARCYIELGDYTKAIEWIDKAVKAPTASVDDENAHKELLSLQYKYSGYRRG